MMTELTTDYFFNNPHDLINLIAALHAVKYPRIRLVDENSNETYIMRTLFDEKETIINVNYKYIDDSRKFTFCLLHELRHVYQILVVFHQKGSEESNIVDLWKKSFEFIQNSLVRGYEYNILEIDANAFALMMNEYLFNDSNFAPAFHQTEIFKQIYNWLKRSFTIEDINESLYAIDLY